MFYSHNFCKNIRYPPLNFQPVVIDDSDIFVSVQRPVAIAVADGQLDFFKFFYNFFFAICIFIALGREAG